MNNVENKVVIITGASSGIGEETLQSQTRYCTPFHSLTMLMFPTLLYARAERDNKIKKLIITALYDTNKVLSSVKVNDLNGYFDVEPNKKYMMKVFAWDKTTLEPKCDSIAFDNLQTTAVETIPQTGYTQVVPSEYTQTATEQGTVVALEYDTKDYVRDGATIKKTAWL